MSPFIEERIHALETKAGELEVQIVELQGFVIPERRIAAAPDALSIAEAARLLGRHRNTIAGWVRHGRLPAEHVGREKRIKRADLQRIVEESK